MKFGDMKSDIDISNGTAQNFLGNYTKGAFIREGRRLLKNHPEYQYLEEDPWLHDPWGDGKGFDENRFYRSIACAYMVDQFLKQNPDFNEEYKKIVQKRINEYKDGNRKINKQADKAYSKFNFSFLSWYSDYLREQADPGVLERERKEWEREQKNLQIAHDIRKMQAKMKEQQDLANGTRVLCPYCKSADTKKLTALNRAVSVSLVGAASGKIGKQWHCNHCGSDF